MNTRDHGLLNEKYRPQDLSTFIGNAQLKDQLQSFIDQDDIMNMLLYGPPGTGKTTLAKLIVKNIDCDYMMINASDERGIETIRDKVQSFASTMSFKTLKVVILDEADFLTLQAQASLKNIIETFSKSTRFILTCNHLERVDKAIRSRCQTVAIIPPSKSAVAKHLVIILENEKISYTKEDIFNIVNKCYPDMRVCINTLQISIKDNKIELDLSNTVSAEYMVEVVDELKKPKPNWKSIRQIIADSGSKDFEGLYRLLYDKVEEYAPGNEGSVMIYLNEMAYQANFNLDKEINIMSLINQIINLK